MTRLFKEFFESERAGGLVLVFCTVFSLLLANASSAYVQFWQFEIFHHHLVHWINDGLMTFFFLLIGLELEREIYVGELSTARNAVLPVVAAIGGMAVPATLYYALNVSHGNVRGAGIPMATDIAFALGVLSLLGNRVPSSLKIFLTAFAVIDDLGAILIIAVFYTHAIDWTTLGLAIAIFIFLVVLNRTGIRSLWIYLPLGILLWFCMLHSGVHATITGVLLAFAVPFGKGDHESPSYKLQHLLHKPVAFIILPIFALANTAIVVGNDFKEGLVSAISVGIIAGLFAGKPIGIISFCYAALRARIADMPIGVRWPHIVGVGFLGGIGFTMSIFISMLAFDDAATINQSKIAVIIISVVAGIIGFLLLKNTRSSLRQGEQA